VGRGCDHCDAWHWHGPLEGHRIAHCHDPESPYEARGYNIRLGGGCAGAGVVTKLRQRHVYGNRACGSIGSGMVAMQSRRNTTR